MPTHTIKAPQGKGGAGGHQAPNLPPITDPAAITRRRSSQYASLR